MGLQAHLQPVFPGAQLRALTAALQGYRRRVDQNLDAVAAPLNATTTIATLTCPAAELQPGSCMHLHVAGLITTLAGAAYNLTPLIALNGTTIWTDVVQVGTVVNEDKVFVIDARIFWKTPSVVVMSGVIMVSPDIAIADTGTGSLADVAAIADEANITPIYHTLSSQVMGRDQILTVTLTVPNTADTGASKKIAALWVE